MAADRTGRTRKAKLININTKLTLTILCQYPGVLQCLGILVGYEQPALDNQVSPTVMRQHEMPMFLLQQILHSGRHIMTQSETSAHVNITELINVITILKKAFCCTYCELQ